MKRYIAYIPHGIFCLFLFGGFFLFTPCSLAQQAQSRDSVITHQTYDNPVLRDVKVQRSLFFMPNDIAAILSARRGYVPSEEVYEKDQVDLGPRYIKLAGIVYVNRNDWVIWLNDEKITPQNIPERVVDLVVYRDRINIKWHDVGLQRIVVFTLKPHQRFHLDTGLLLPG